ncbi:hypothetical protein FB451DRAFT_1192356 [Mycena latifolia]|nr:hypothetical protein FB451DRAFT_1192356 [Mycena latifolia]
MNRPAEPREGQFLCVKCCVALRAVTLIISGTSTWTEDGAQRERRAPEIGASAGRTRSASASRGSTRVSPVEESTNIEREHNIQPPAALGALRARVCRRRSEAPRSHGTGPHVAPSTVPRTMPAPRPSMEHSMGRQSLAKTWARAGGGKEGAPREEEAPAVDAVKEEGARSTTQPTHATPPTDARSGRKTRASARNKGIRMSGVSQEGARQSEMERCALGGAPCKKGTREERGASTIRGWRYSTGRRRLRDETYGSAYRTAGGDRHATSDGAMGLDRRLTRHAGAEGKAGVRRRKGGRSVRTRLRGMRVHLSPELSSTLSRRAADCENQERRASRTVLKTRSHRKKGRDVLKMCWRERGREGKPNKRRFLPLVIPSNIKTRAERTARQPAQRR